MPDDIDALPGLKEREIARLGPCAVCRKPLLDREAGSLTFYRLTISRALFVPSNLSRRMGLQMVLGGSAALARAMGPDEDLAKVIDGPKEVAVHETCASDVHHLMMLFGAKVDD